jgi:hypothetical protein
MKKVVLFALVAALAAGALLYIYLGKLEQKNEVTVVYEDVLVAAADIPAYSAITEEMVTVKQVPQGTSHPLADTHPAEAVGFVTENLIVKARKSCPSSSNSPARPKAGFRMSCRKACAQSPFPWTKSRALPGLFQRGDYVDVLAFISVKVLRLQRNGSGSLQGRNRGWTHRRRS